MKDKHTYTQMITGLGFYLRMARKKIRKSFKKKSKRQETDIPWKRDPAFQRGLSWVVISSAPCHCFVNVYLLPFHDQSLLGSSCWIPLTSPFQSQLFNYHPDHPSWAHTIFIHVKRKWEAFFQRLTSLFCKYAGGLKTELNLLIKITSLFCRYSISWKPMCRY